MTWQTLHTCPSAFGDTRTRFHKNRCGRRSDFIQHSGLFGRTRQSADGIEHIHPRKGNDNHNKYILWYTTLGRNEANQKRLRDTTTTAHLEHYSKRPTVSTPQYYGHGLLLYEANMIAITSKGPAIPHHSKYYPTLRVIPAKQHIWWRLVWWKWRNGARRNRILWLYLE